MSNAAQGTGQAGGTWVIDGVDYPVMVSADPATGFPDMENARTWDQLSEEERESSRDAGFFFGNWEAGEKPIRQMTKEEREVWGKAVFNATRILPAFQPSVAILTPGRDRSAGTIYTDEKARVGVGDLFFYKWNDQQRATAVLHESMHVLYNHFARFKRLSLESDQLMNIAGDFEINGALAMQSRCDISQGVHPETKINVAPDHPWAPMNGRPLWGSDMSVGKTMEQYYDLLEKNAPDEDGDDGGSSQPGSGQCPVHGGGESAGESGAPGQGSGGESSDKGEGGGESSDGTGGSEGTPGDESGDGSSEGSGEGSEKGSGGPDGDSPGQGSGEGSPGVSGHSHSDSGSKCECQGWSCATPTEEKSEALEGIGARGVSDSEKENARSNTKSNIIEEKKKSKSYGDGAGDSFLDLVMNQLREPKVPWQSIFRQVFTRSANNVIAGRTDYSFRRTNRRMSGSRYIFPGMVSYQPEVAFGIDTSGSMAVPDYMALLQEAETIIKTVAKNGKGLSVFSVDTKISNVQRVHSVHDIDLHGGGGTDMSAAFKYLNDLPKKDRPDIFVLSTDGFIPWDPVIEELRRREAFYTSIILITASEAYDNVPDEVKRLATVLDVSLDDE